MRMNQVDNDEQLRDFMTTPRPELIDFTRQLEGDVAVLGAAGKMGPDLVETFLRADHRNARDRKVYAVSRFSDPDGVELSRLQETGADILRGDLTDKTFLTSLPDVSNVIYMVGFKFGSSSNYRQTWHINSILPYLVGSRFPDSRIVVFSSTNPYPHLAPDSGGASERTELDPTGVYGWSVVARESSFATSQLESDNQQLLMYRLAYAQHLGYGVLVDLARMIRNGDPISLQMPAVNLISQRDAVDVALRSLSLCDDPPEILNCTGPVCDVRDIVEQLGEQMGREPVLADDPGPKALIADDSKCRSRLGNYRDRPDEMIEAAARWVENGGSWWGKPTKFGQVDHSY